MSDLQNISNAMADLVEGAAAHIVRVDARRRMAASGVVWSEDGVIVTTHHVVRREESISVGLADGSEVEATLVGRDPSTDLAVLKVEASGLAVPDWADRATLRVGHLVLAVARPRQSIQATQGIISAVRNGRGPGENSGQGHGRRAESRGEESRGEQSRGRGQGRGGPDSRRQGRHLRPHLQTDVLMYPGFSGGPLVTMAGALAGINTSALRQGASLTIPAETVTAVVATLLAHGKMPRGYLGVGLQPVRLTAAFQESLEQETGIMVMSVEPDGPAATAGLVQGDVIVALDGEQTPHIDALQMLLSGDRVGSTVSVQLVRGGQLQEADVTIGQAE